MYTHLFRLGYLQYLQEKDKKLKGSGQVNSSIVGVEEAETLGDNLWSYLQPDVFGKVDKAKFYQIIKLLHMKAGKESDSKL